jgi:ABC-type lipoprotein release transport system permease subunit
MDASGSAAEARALSLPGLVGKNLLYFWRTNLAVASAVAIAVAVLTGALLVGDSVRGSLRDLFLARLGNTDTAVLASGFFREELASELSTSAAPLAVFVGMVTNPRTGARRAGVEVFGVDERFWRFHGAKDPGMEAREALLSASLAEELDVAEGDAVLLRVEKSSEVARGSLHGAKEDVGRTIRLSVRSGLATTGLSEFSIYPRQESVPALFLPLARVQRDLDEYGRVNAVLLSAHRDPESVAEALRAVVTLDDLSLVVREVGGVVAVESRALVLAEPVVNSVAAFARESSLRKTSFFTYLANRMQIGEREVPYSLVTAIEGEGLPISPTASGIVLNEWVGDDLRGRPGDSLTMEFYVWEDEGRIATRTARFTVDGVVPISGLAADRDLAPRYPGISETESLSDWEPPFPIDLRRVRDKDEEYWDRYRTTPKGFIALARGQEIWPVRQGNVTSIRLAPADGADPSSLRAAVEKRLRGDLDPLEMGFSILEAREKGLEAATGATDFGEYFLYFSYFLVTAAVLLVGLFFKLGVEQRHREIGTLFATGFTVREVLRIFLAEGLVLSLLGASAGVLGGLGYAALILEGLRTFWVDAVGTTLLTLHASFLSLVAGGSGGVLAALAATWLTLRYLKRVPARGLLAGELSRGGRASRAAPSRRALGLGVAALGAGILLVGLAASGVVGNVPGFFGAGNLALIALLTFQWSLFRSGGTGLVAGAGVPALAQLGFRNTTERPGRSLVAVALIAFATFTIVAVDAFRKDDSGVAALDRSSGSGGFALMAESLLPLHWDPNTDEGRNAFNLPYPDEAGAIEMAVQTFRLRSGDDASCLNLYRPQNPRILAPAGDFLSRGGFRFQSSLAETDEERANPWRLLKKTFPDGAIPVIGDANSMKYVLHLDLGSDFLLPRARQSEPLKLRLVATLEDSVFQSELLMAEEPFLAHFPEASGFRFFLVDVAPENQEAAAALLEKRLSDYGLDVRPTAERIAEFHRVENTYLSTFQSLGGLGLALGTLGLGAVLLRNVLERRREIALLRAVGFRTRDLAAVVLSENSLLLFLGVLTGALSAALAIVPALLERGGGFAFESAAALLLAVVASGILSSLLAVRSALRSPLLEALRSE